MRPNKGARVCLRVVLFSVLFIFSSYVANASTETLLTTQTPQLLNVTDGSTANYELGMKFTSGVAGQITAIRFWKASRETGTHVGHIWTSSGQLLASATFVSETASGWQQQSLATPLSINANTVYVVTVNTGNTFYAVTDTGFSNQIVHLDLKSIVGGNGVYGSPGRFPTTTWESSNYFRDIVFTPATTPGLVSSASTLDLGDVNVGSSAAQTLTLTNKANSSITISKVAASGSGFSLTAPSVPVTLSSGQQTSLNVTFAPATMGTASGSVSITSNASNPTLTTALKGVGKQARISVVPSSVGFGSVAVGVNNTQTLTVGNPGNANLVISKDTLAGSGFTVSAVTLPLTVIPGSSAALTVGFDPASAIAYSGSLSLASNAPGSPTSVPLSGTGVAKSAQLSSTPTAVSFGNVTQGTSAAQTITLKNSGNTSLSVSKITAAGTYFAASVPALPVTLSVGQTLSFTTTFSPSAAGSFTGSASVVSTATNSPLSIPLSGTGVSTATHKASLTWTPSTSTVAGYNVYRGTQNGGPYSKINSSVVTGSAYTDSSVQAGTTYYYVVTSVTSAGVESVHSSQVSGTIP